MAAPASVSFPHTYQQNFEAYDLLHAQSALLKNASDLFVEGTAASRLEFQQYVPLSSKESDGLEKGLQPDQDGTVPPTSPKTITTLHELQAILQVSTRDSRVTALVSADRRSSRARPWQGVTSSCRCRQEPFFMRRVYN
jgi:hypothetical protein